MKKIGQKQKKRKTEKTENSSAQRESEFVLK